MARDGSADGAWRLPLLVVTTDLCGGAGSTRALLEIRIKRCRVSPNSQTIASGGAQAGWTNRASAAHFECAASTEESVMRACRLQGASPCMPDEFHSSSFIEQPCNQPVKSRTFKPLLVCRSPVVGGGGYEVDEFARLRSPSISPSIRLRWQGAQAQNRSS